MSNQRYHQDSAFILRHSKLVTDFKNSITSLRIRRFGNGVQLKGTGAPLYKEVEPFYSALNVHLTHRAHNEGECGGKMNAILSSIKVNPTTELVAGNTHIPPLLAWLCCYGDDDKGKNAGAAFYTHVLEYYKGLQIDLDDFWYHPWEGDVPRFKEPWREDTKPGAGAVQDRISLARRQDRDCNSASLLRSRNAQESQFNELISDYQAGYVPHEIENDVIDYYRKKKSGFVILAAGPGSGKTAIIASLARRAQDFSEQAVVVPYFFRYGFGLEDYNTPSGFYDYACSILGARFPSAINLVNSTGKTRETFCEALKILGAVSLISPAKPLIVLIDALDEIFTRTYSGGDAESHPNPLGLPTALPDGVFFIQASRFPPTKTQESLLGPNRQIIRINEGDNSERHESVVKQYVRRVCHTNPKIIPFHGTDENPVDGAAADEFVDGLCRDAGYNFMILKSILHEEDNWTQQGSKTRISNSLADYYHNHIERMSKIEENKFCYRAIYTLGKCPDISERIFSKMLVNNRSEFDLSLGEKPIRSWVSQGLIQRYDSGACDRLLPYHRTFREFIEEKFNGLKHSTELATVIQNLIYGVSTEDEFAELDSIGQAESSDWFGITIELTIKAENFFVLKKLIMNRGFWKRVNALPESLYIAFRHIGCIRPNSQSKADATKLLEEFATFFVELVTSGELRDESGAKYSVRDIDGAIRNSASNAVQAENIWLAPIMRNAFLIRGRRTDAD